METPTAERKCPRCHLVSRVQARFCARCGLLLEQGVSGPLRVGLLKHPSPLAAPEDFEPCGDAEHLYFRWESAWGGSMLSGTESIAVVLFNGGYPLESVALKVIGRDNADQEVFGAEHKVQSLPRGREVKLEVPSYELPAPVRELSVSLITGEFGEEEHSSP